MGINYFTDEQVEKLRKNVHVKQASIKGITYHESFKEYFLDEYAKGKPARVIFIEAGFDIEALGSERVKAATKRWRAQSKRIEGLKDTRKGGSGRPLKRDLTQDEIIERQRVQIEYLKQERDFLLELKRLERQAIRKQKLSPKKSLKSSKR